MEDLTGIVFCSFFSSETCGDLPRPAGDMFLQVEGEPSPSLALPQRVVIMITVMKMMVQWVTDGMGLCYWGEGFPCYLFFIYPCPFNC